MTGNRPSSVEVDGLPAKAAYERYAEALRHYLVRRVRRPENVEDLTQEIFELFVRRKDQQQVVRNPLAYLFRIAFHVVGATLADEDRNPVTFGFQSVPGSANIESRGSRKPGPFSRVRG